MEKRNILTAGGCGWRRADLSTGDTVGQPGTERELGNNLAKWRSLKQVYIERRVIADWAQVCSSRK